MINGGTHCWSKGDVVKVTVRRAAVLCLLLILGIGVMETSAEEFLAQSMQSSQQDEFVPIDELEAEAQLPAAPLLVAAYSFAWFAMFVYLWSIWRRLARVERELAHLASRTTER